MSFHFKLIIFIIIICNKSYALETENHIEVTAQSLSIDHIKKTATFKGDVIAKESDIIIKANKMIIHYIDNIEKISKIEFFDNVTIIQKDQIAKGEHGLYEISSNIIELNNNVTLTKNSHILKGSNLIYNLNDSQVQIYNKNKEDKKIKAIFSPNN